MPYQFHFPRLSHATLEQHYSTKTPKKMVMQSTSMTLYNSCGNISDDYKSVAFQKNFVMWYL